MQGLFKKKDLLIFLPKSEGALGWGGFNFPPPPGSDGPVAVGLARAQTLCVATLKENRTW